MKHKIVEILIIGLFIITSIFPGIYGFNESFRNFGYNDILGYENVNFCKVRLVDNLNNNINNKIFPEEKLNNLFDFLDQYNNETSNEAWSIYYNNSNNFQFVAQSFKPSLPTLSRIKLAVIAHNMSSSERCPLIVSIRSSLNDDDLVSISKDPSFFPGCSECPDYEWVEFDFPDLNIDINHDYYIVAKCNCGNSYWANGFHYDWGFSNDTYPNGIGFLNFTNYPWHGISLDLLFETYGYGGGSQKKIIINSISGSFGVNAEILNNWVAPAYNVNWSIDVELIGSIGIIISGNHTEGVINRLGENEAKPIQSSYLRGIGPITITIQADDASKKATAFLLGPLVLRLTEL